ncbi:hypothetical protein OPV22_011908 [Ensete ventricosum]|uniref:Uncharacterized protein n=1 Tax=Ensete ventricosum TaxID=4639 RepID=A0AAV8RP15_ENSVE|nr:hypothetical protein OPV22_011908 [Ensete ventricosum]
MGLFGCLNTRADFKLPFHAAVPSVSPPLDLDPRLHPPVIVRPSHGQNWHPGALSSPGSEDDFVEGRSLPWLHPSNPRHLSPISSSTHLLASHFESATPPESSPRFGRRSAADGLTPVDLAILKDEPIDWCSYFGLSYG